MIICLVQSGIKSLIHAGIKVNSYSTLCQFLGKLIIIGLGDGLSPGRRQAIIWTNAGMLLIWPSGTNLNKMMITIHIFSFKKMHSKMSSAKWRPFCLGLNVLITPPYVPKYLYYISIIDIMKISQCSNVSYLRKDLDKTQMLMPMAILKQRKNQLLSFKKNAL